MLQHQMLMWTAEGLAWIGEAFLALVLDAVVPKPLVNVEDLRTGSLNPPPV